MAKTANRKPHPVDVAAGHQLRLARVRAGLTQTTLGNAVGITFQQIQKYERGTNRMSLSRAAQFAHVLRISPAQFFIGSQQDWTEPVAGLDRWIDLLAHAQRGAMDTHLIKIAQAVVSSWRIEPISFGIIATETTQGLK